jgi:hypothetical protein
MSEAPPEYAAWAAERERWREHDKRIVDALPAVPLRHYPDFVRAGGGVVCESCGRTYYRHPLDPRYVDQDGNRFLNVTCDGRMVKL